MIRDIIDSLMAGGLLSFLPIWTIQDAGDQIGITVGAAVLTYCLILRFSKENKHD